MWNGSVYNIKNTLIVQFLNEIYRKLTKSFRFLPSRIRKNSCSYRPAESQREHACHSDRKTQLSDEQNNRLGDSMNEKLLLLIPRLTVEYKGQKGAYQQRRIKRFTVPLSHVPRRWNLMPTRWRLSMRACDPWPRAAISFPEAAILLVSDGDRDRFFQRMTKGTPGDEATSSPGSSRFPIWRHISSYREWSIQAFVKCVRNDRIDHFSNKDCCYYPGLLA